MRYHHGLGVGHIYGRPKLRRSNAVNGAIQIDGMGTSVPGPNSSTVRGSSELGRHMLVDNASIGDDPTVGNISAAVAQDIQVNNGTVEGAARASDELATAEDEFNAEDPALSLDNREDEVIMEEEEEEEENIGEGSYYQQLEGTNLDDEMLIHHADMFGLDDDYYSQWRDL